MNVTRGCSLLPAMAFGSLSSMLFAFLFFVGGFGSGACRLRAMLCGCVRDFVDVDVLGEFKQGEQIQLQLKCCFIGKSREDP